MTSFKKVLSLSILSRIFLILYTILCGIVNTDYDTSGHKGSIISSLIRWDSIWFSGISESGYLHEQTFAFFPGYPILVKIMSAFTHLSIPLCGVIISNTSFVLASLVLYELGKITLHDEKKAYRSFLLFLITPSNIFMSSFYTESIFSFFTFTGCYLIQNFQFVGKNRIKSICKLILSIVFFTLSSTIRSNGTVNVGFIIYSLFLALKNWIVSQTNNEQQEKKKTEKQEKKQKKENEKQAQKQNQKQKQKKKQQENPNQKQKQKENENENAKLKGRITFFSLLVMVFKIILVSLIIIISLILIFSPVVYFQYKAYLKFCKGSTIKQTPEWCFLKIPSIYNYIQLKYWNVGFLNYWTPLQIPNFLLAAPMIFSILMALIRYIKNDFKRFLTLGLAKSGRSQIGFFSNDTFVYIFHLIFLGCVGLFFMHIQVITRFVTSSSPVIFWFLEDYLSDQKVHKFKKAILLFWFILYTFIGPLLFSNFYPWT
ncbi:gpi mannosyltransferase 2 [Anaeramoeba flamelloides]|uniref:GPI mannosyltransferase 2 n=1 Tax=Anaeramoeba flamelloides TaxID=1746091 RepID=A0ABQ8YV65_9EUKA|nr:gpi mannosyltransferase 2 [Anaeramoeba flamelloides]